MPMPRGKEVVHRVDRSVELDEARLAPVMEIDLRPHPTRDLGHEYAHEIGCRLCTRIGTRPAWERAGWYCPFDHCPGGPEDVITSDKAFAMRTELGPKHKAAPIIKHGTERRFAYGCRCYLCREAVDGG